MQFKPMLKGLWCFLQNLSGFFSVDLSILLRKIKTNSEFISIYLFPVTVQWMNNLYIY